jgi:hypothetical protein
VEIKLAFFRLVYNLLKPKVKSGMNYWRFILTKSWSYQAGLKGAAHFKNNTLWHFTFVFLDKILSCRSRSDISLSLNGLVDSNKSSWVVATFMKHEKNTKFFVWNNKGMSDFHNGEFPKDSAIMELILFEVFTLRG